MPSAFLYCRGKSKRGSNQSWCTDPIFSTSVGFYRKFGLVYMTQIDKLSVLSELIFRMPVSVYCRLQLYS